MNEPSQFSQYDSSLYFNIPLYEGKHIFNSDVSGHIQVPASVYGLIILVILFICFILIPRAFNIEGLLIITIISVLIAVKQSYETELVKVEVDIVGITKMYGSRKMNLSWENVDYIKVIPRYNGTKSKVIYIKNIVSSDNDKQPKTNKIVMPYSPKAAHCIIRYWKNEMQNLDSMKSWQRYIERL